MKDHYWVKYQVKNESFWFSKNCCTATTAWTITAITEKKCMPRKLHQWNPMTGRSKLVRLFQLFHSFIWKSFSSYCFKFYFNYWALCSQNRRQRYYTQQTIKWLPFAALIYPRPEKSIYTSFERKKLWKVKLHTKNIQNLRSLQLNF